MLLDCELESSRELLQTVAADHIPINQHTNKVVDDSVSVLHAIQGASSESRQDSSDEITNTTQGVDSQSTHDSGDLTHSGSSPRTLLVQTHGDDHDAIIIANNTTSNLPKELQQIDADTVNSDSNTTTHKLLASSSDHHHSGAETVLVETIASQVVCDSSVVESCESTQSVGTTTSHEQQLLSSGTQAPLLECSQRAGETSTSHQEVLGNTHQTTLLETNLVVGGDSLTSSRHGDEEDTDEMGDGVLTIPVSGITFGFGEIENER